MSFTVGEQRVYFLYYHPRSCSSFFVSQPSRCIARTPHLWFCSSRSSSLPPCSFDNDSFSLPLSVSIPLFHCPFTSLRLSARHQSFPSGIELLCLPPRLPRSSSRPAITAYLLSPLPFPPPPTHSHLCLTGYIGSSLRCLGLWQPVSYSK